MLKRTLPLLCAVAFAVAPSALSAQATLGTDAAMQMGDASGALGTSRSTNLAAALLLKRVEGVDWIDTPYEEVIDWLRDLGEGRVNIIPRWGPLSVESIGRESLVNLKLNNTSVAEVLAEVHDQLSEDGQIAYRAIGNSLKISTKADFGRRLYVRVYDVTDVIFRVEDFGEEAPQIDLQQTGGGGGGGGGGQSVFQGAGGQGGQQGGEQAEQELEEKLTELRELVEQTIEPVSWDVAGSGGQGRIRIFNRSLIVYNTVEVHEQIAGLFAFN